MGRQISFSQAINEAMKLAMRRDENVILMGKMLPAVRKLITCRMKKHGVACLA